MRKILSVVLALTLVLGSFSFVFAAPNDVAGTKYEDAVEELMTLGIVDGYGDGTIRPNQTIKREEFAKLIVVALGLEDLVAFANDTTQFTDVPENSWAKGYINIAAGQGLVKGRGDGTFGYGDNITYGEVITIILRALGYDDSLPGQWPYDYIVKAKDLGVTDDVTVSTGAAIRGDVFLLVDNSLRVPMVEKNEDGVFVEKEDDTLLAKVGFDKITGVMTARVNDDNEITLVDADGKEHVVIVPENFDSEANFGLELTVWVNGDDEVKLFEVNDTPLLDALAWDGDKEKLKLVEADKAYEVSEDATLYLNGEEVDLDDVADLDGADYAKVVLNDDEEVVLVDAYTWDNEGLLVKEVEDNVIFGYNGEELDVEDFTVIKEGKTITADDIEKKDLVFYNEDLGYAEVYVDTLEGELERVYVDSFRLDGDDYDIESFTTYLDGSSEYKVNDEVLDTMADEGNVTLYLNRLGEVRFVDGELGEVETSILAIYLTDDIVRDQDVRGNYDYYVDGVDENGNEVSYVISHSVMLDAVAADAKDAYEAANGDGSWDSLTSAQQKTEKENYLTGLFPTDDSSTVGEEVVLADQVVEIELDEDGDVAGFTFPGASTNFDDGSGNAVAYEDMLGLDANYIEHKRLTDSVVVFDVTDSNDIKATTWGEVESFELIGKATVYYGADGYVDYLVVRATDNEEKTYFVDALVTDVRKVTGSDVWRITAYVGDEEEVYYTDGEVTVSIDDSDDVVDIVKLGIDENTEEIVSIDTPNTPAIVTGTLDDVSISDDEVTVAGDVYSLVSDYVVFDATNTAAISEISIRDLNSTLEDNNVNVKIVLDEENSVFANMVVMTAKTDKTTTPIVTDKITASYAGTTLTINVTDIEDAYAVRVYDVDSGAAIGGFSVLSDGSATFTVDPNPVFVQVKVYDAELNVLADEPVAVE